MILDENMIIFELNKARKKHQEYSIGNDVILKIKEAMETAFSTHYYPYGGFTRGETVNSMLYDTFSDFYFTNLIFGEINGVKYRRADVHSVKEFYDDGSIKSGNTLEDFFEDSILFEFHFGEIFSNNLLINPDSSISRFNSYVSEETFDGYDNKKIPIYEKWMYKIKKYTAGKVALGIVALAAGTTRGLEPDYELVKKENFTSNQILNENITQIILQLFQEYKNDISVSFISNCMYVKLHNKTTFDQTKLLNGIVEKENIDKAKKQLLEFAKIISLFEKNTFIERKLGKEAYRNG